MKGLAAAYLIFPRSPSAMRRTRADSRQRERAHSHRATLSLSSGFLRAVHPPPPDPTIRPACTRRSAWVLLCPRREHPATRPCEVLLAECWRRPEHLRSGGARERLPPPCGRSRSVYEGRAAPVTSADHR